jgi:hypothetical protein
LKISRIKNNVVRGKSKPFSPSPGPAKEKFPRVSPGAILCYRKGMVWIILFLPVCIWMGIGIISRMNLLSIACTAITVIVFAFLELGWLSREEGRSKVPLWIMGMMLGSIVLGVVWKYWPGVP